MPLVLNNNFYIFSLTINLIQWKIDSNYGAPSSPPV